MEWLKIWDEGLPVVAKNANTKDLILSTVSNAELDLFWMKRRNSNLPSQIVITNQNL